jgi:hypothetical protein
MIIRKIIDEHEEGLPFVDYFKADTITELDRIGDWYYAVETEELYHNHRGTPAESRQARIDGLTCSCGETLPEHIYRQMILRSIE